MIRLIDYIWSEINENGDNLSAVVDKISQSEYCSMILCTYIFCVITTDSDVLSQATFQQLELLVSVKE